jgi:hypothetical protein
MLEVPMQHSGDFIEEDNAQEINPIDELNDELNPENPETQEINPEEITHEEQAPVAAPKKRGRPRKAPAAPPPPPVPSPGKTRKAPRAAAPKVSKIVRAPPRERARAEEESYPQANPFDSISSTELVAELLGRRAAEDRDRTRHMYRSWLS